MRKLLFTVVIEIVALAAGLAPLQVGAQPVYGARSLAIVEQNFTPVEKAACQGWGRWCSPGFVRTCGPYRCWCRPCR